MKLSLELTVATKPEWIDAVMANLPSFLQDHADCERKASALAMSLVAKYPDRLKIIPELIATGVEELEHFQKVYEVMRERGIPLTKEIGKDPYITALMKLLHSDLLRRFLDRLLLASIIECRGAERFRIVSQALEDDKKLQQLNGRSTGGLQNVALAREFAPASRTEGRPRQPLVRCRYE